MKLPSRGPLGRWMTPARKRCLGEIDGYPFSNFTRPTPAQKRSPHHVHDEGMCHVVKRHFVSWLRRRNPFPSTNVWLLMDNGSHLLRAQAQDAIWNCNRIARRPVKVRRWRAASGRRKTCIRTTTVSSGRAHGFGQYLGGWCQRSSPTSNNHPREHGHHLRCALSLCS